MLAEQRVATDMDNHRSSSRSRTLLPARIEFYDGAIKLECVVKDLSETGARIRVSESVSIPESFRLYLPKTDRWFDAQLKWRRTDLIGVAFENADNKDIAPDAPPVIDQRYVERLEHELANVKRILAEIKADPSRARLLLEDAA